MSDQFLAEIRIFPFNFEPNGWAFCNGQILPIVQYTALFSLLGTTYGGNGTNNFALPNFQSRGSLGQGMGPGLSQRDLGETGGEQNITLTAQQIPAHTHTPNAKSAGTLTSPSGAIWGEPAIARPAPNFYATSLGTPVNMAANAIGPAGFSQAHDNMMPYLVLNYCIAMTGIFPPRG